MEHPRLPEFLILGTLASGSENKQNKFVKEQILIVHLGLEFEEAYHPWSKDGDDYTDPQLIQHFVKVFLPLTKSRKVPKETPMEHPRLPSFLILGTLASDVSNYYTEQAATNNELRLKAMIELDKETQMGILDGAEYMNEFNWPEKKLKQGYHIEMCFSYPDEDEENKYSGTVELLRESIEGTTR